MADYLAGMGQLLQIVQMLLGLHLWVVISGSMAPAIKPGSLVVAVPCQQYQIGEIVSYRNPRGEIVTHRLIQEEKGKFITRGDANNVADAPIAKQSVLGKAVFVIPIVGYWFFNFHRLIFSFPLIFGGFLLLFILWVLWEKVRSRHILGKLLNGIALLALMGSGLALNISASQSLFSDQGQSSQNTFTAGDWVRPTSAIDGAENDQGDSIMDVANQPVHILYHADDSSSGVNRVELWFSYNDGAWQYFGLGQNGEFVFSFPHGDGVYRFLTVAIDNAGWREDKDGNGVDDNRDSVELENVASFLAATGDLFQLQYDSQPPTVAWVVPTPGDNLWQGQPALANGDFQQGMEGWTAGGNGDHHIVASGEDLDGNPIVADQGGQMFELGFRSQDKTGQDFLRRLIELPTKVVPYLQFSYRMLSEDVVDYDWLAVKISSPNQGEKTLLKTGSEENDDLYNGDSWAGWQGDSGWRRLTANLQAFQGQEVNLDFCLRSHQNPTGPGRSWAYLSNIELHFLDPRLTTSAELSLDVHDASGSGVDQATYQVNDGSDEDFEGTPVTLASGEATVSAQAVDLAGNNSAPTKLEAKVMADVVLNRFSAAPSSGDEWVELYNNSDSDQDVAGWQICDDGGHCVALTAGNAVGGSTIIESHTSQKFEDDFYLNNNGDTIYLKDDSGVVQDKFSYGDLSNQHDQIWSRNPDGLGSWQLTPGSLTANITSRYNTTGKILLTVYNLPADYGQGDLLEYEITYTDNQGLEKGIAGTILPEEVADGKADREFYLGTCSTGGTCVTNVIPAHQVKLTLRQGTTVIINQKAFAI